jgi:hypothetical protein
MDRSALRAQAHSLRRRIVTSVDEQVQPSYLFRLDLLAELGSKDKVLWFRRSQPGDMSVRLALPGGPEPDSASNMRIPLSSREEQRVKARRDSFAPAMI